MSGYEIVFGGADISPSTFKEVKTLCPPGKRVLGGGYNNIGVTTLGGPFLNVIHSFPRVFEGLFGWSVEVQSNLVFDSNPITVWAVCASF